MARATLGFCGVRPVRSLVCGSVKDASLQQRRHWLEQARCHGQSLGRGRISPGEQFRHKAGAWLKGIRLQFYPMTWLAYTAGRIDGLMAASLTYVLWFGLFPLAG